MAGTAFKRIMLESPTHRPLPEKVQSFSPPCEHEEVDLHLLQIALERCQARTRDQIGPAIVLLLACNGAELRCLQQDRFREILREDLQGLVVHCGEDHDTIRKHVADPRRLINEQQHDAHFEGQCALWLGRLLGLGCHTNEKRWEHEIDVFCENQSDDPRFYIGECKLLHNRSDGREQQQTALNQLRKRLQSGVKHETTTAQWHCYVFCNADFTPEILQEARSITEETGANVRLIRVVMPSQWQQQTNWTLRDDNFREVS